jgi:hypothetical protein
VHQVANNKGVKIDAVIKVNSHYRVFDGTTSEPYALATEENFKKADPPRFVLTATAPAKVGALPQKPIFNVTLDVTNMGDVAAFSNFAILELPLAFNLLSGANPQPIGTIAAGETKTASWKLQAQSWVGDYTFSFANSSYSYYETYTGSTSKSISVVIGTP